MEIYCPHCQEKLYKQEKSYVCINRHTFDIAKEGYLNLHSHKSDNTGDEKTMINARQNFLKQGHYAFLREKINELIKQYDTKSLLDLGCGEGYYTRYFEAKDKTGVDLSKQALKIASKNDKKTLYILKSIFELPFKPESFDTIITIFAPLSDQIESLLKKQGHFIFVKPDKDHLIELKQAIYKNAYYNEPKEEKINGLIQKEEIKLKNKALLTNSEIKNLFTMTPYYHKTSKEDITKLDDIQEMEITFSFIIDVKEKL